MASADKSGNSTLPEKEGWLAYLDEEIKNSDADSPVRNDLLSNLKNLFLSDCGTQDIVDAANQIDSYYYNTYVDLDPLRKFSEDKMAHYLPTVYGSIFDLARNTGYEDSRNDILIQLIRELHKLPAKTFRIWGVSFPLAIFSSTLTLTVTRKIALYIATNLCLVVLCMMNGLQPKVEYFLQIKFLFPDHLSSKN